MEISKTTKTLEIVPREIWDQICEPLSRHDLCQLRLVCRGAGAALSCYIFSKVYITTSMSSLENLRAVAHHPVLLPLRQGACLRLATRGPRQVSVAHAIRHVCQKKPQKGGFFICSRQVPDTARPGEPKVREIFERQVHPSKKSHYEQEQAARAHVRAHS